MPLNWSKNVEENRRRLEKYNLLVNEVADKMEMSFSGFSLIS